MLPEWCIFFGSEEIGLKPRQQMAPLYAYLLLAAAVSIWFCRHQISRIFFCSPNKPALDWAKTRLPAKWSSHFPTLSGGLQDLWQDGSLLCALINSVVPEACSDPHRHFNKRPVHAQELALKYFGIHSVFTEEDFSVPWSTQLEAQLLDFLLLLQNRILALEHSKPPSEVTSTFLVRGMGLYTAEQFKEADFFIYSHHSNFGQLEVAILGPFNSQCCTSFKDLLENLQLKSSSNNIKIQMLVEETRLKVSYVPQHCGVHEIRLTCNQESLEGSPYHVNVLNYSLFKCKGSAMAISKYLKELTNSREKLQAQKENFASIQKMVDSSFRVTCKVTRASPAQRGRSFAQFSNSSPVCERHTAAEDCRKLPMEERRKMFCSQSQVTSEVGEIRHLLHGFWGHKQQQVFEKKQFWESAFERQSSGSESWSRRLKHVDSLYLLRKRPVSKSMSSRSRDQKKTLWFEDYLDLCSRISLDERLKSFRQSSVPVEVSGCAPRKLE